MERIQLPALLAREESIKASVDFNVKSILRFRSFNRSFKENLSREGGLMVSEKRLVTLNKQMMQMEMCFMRIDEVSRGTKVEFIITDLKLK
ncbi:MAG: hypothetical protein SH857_02680 [Chitinophagales bacterium]|nr:hypothetical protein [Chitinophagales bacterium]